MESISTISDIYLDGYQNYGGSTDKQWGDGVKAAGHEPKQGNAELGSGWL